MKAESFLIIPTEWPTLVHTEFTCSAKDNFLSIITPKISICEVRGKLWHRCLLRELNSAAFAAEPARIALSLTCVDANKFIANEEEVYNDFSC